MADKHREHIKFKTEVLKAVILVTVALGGGSGSTIVLLRPPCAGKEEKERLTAEHERRQRLEARYRSLSLTEQTSLRERATNDLLQGGVSRRLLLETLVMGEVYRLLEEQMVPQGSE